MTLCVLNFHTSKQSYSYKYLLFSTCTRMLMHGIIRRDHTNTASESALKSDPGRTIPCHTGEWNLYQLHAGTSAQSPEPHPRPAICTDLEVEMEENDHFTVTGLEEGMFDVVVQDIHLVSSHRREPEPWQKTTTKLRLVILIYTVTNHNGSESYLFTPSQITTEVGHTYLRCHKSQRKWVILITPSQITTEVGHTYYTLPKSQLK